MSFSSFEFATGALWFGEIPVLQVVGPDQGDFFKIKQCIESVLDFAYIVLDVRVQADAAPKLSTVYWKPVIPSSKNYTLFIELKKAFHGKEANEGIVTCMRNEIRWNCCFSCAFDLLHYNALYSTAFS